MHILILSFQPRYIGCALIDALDLTQSLSSMLGNHRCLADNSNSNVRRLPTSGKFATAAQVKKLVLTDFAPSGGPFDKDELWLKDVQRDFKGAVIVGHDLRVIE